MPTNNVKIQRRKNTRLWNFFTFGFRVQTKKRIQEQSLPIMTRCSLYLYVPARNDLHIRVNPDRPNHPFPCPPSLYFLHCSFQSLLDRLDRGIFLFWRFIKFWNFGENFVFLHRNFSNIFRPKELGILRIYNAPKMENGCNLLANLTNSLYIL